MSCFDVVGEVMAVVCCDFDVVSQVCSADSLCLHFHHSLLISDFLVSDGWIPDLSCSAAHIDPPTAIRTIVTAKSAFSTP